MSAKPLDKADGRLKRALAQAGDADVSAMLVLRGGQANPPPRSAFPDKRAWQQEAARSLRESARSDFEPFLSGLRGRGMDVRGGDPGRVVTVRGSAAAIESALAADLVEHASLADLYDEPPPSPPPPGEDAVELRDVQFGARPMVQVRGIRPSTKTVRLVVTVDGREAGCLFVQGVGGGMPLPVDAYDRSIPLRVEPHARASSVRVSAHDGDRPVAIGALSVSPA